ncbi:conserved hypothetical protein [Plantibacter sp. T3]|nr:conserved hypothetical protein [Plantibacter sp. T3]
MGRERTPMDLWARILFLVLGLTLVVFCTYAIATQDFLRPRFYVFTGLAGGLMLLGALVVDAVKRRGKSR